MSGERAQREVCERENLAYSGHIQPYGVLIRVNSSLAVTHFSRNAEIIALEVNGQPLSIATGLDVSQWLSTQEVSFLHSFLFENRDSVGAESWTLPGCRCQSGRSWSLSLSALPDGAIALEWEPEENGNLPNRDSSTALRLFTGQGDDERYETLLQAVEEIVPCGRCMVYRFEPDGSGTVVAEHNHDFPVDVKGLRYVSSDIPKIARQLYEDMPVRYIANPKQDSVPIEGFSESPFSLGFTNMRSVSPYHRAYLESMGVETSLSVAIRIKSELWGLICVQSRTPLLIPRKQRESLVGLSKSFATATLLSTAETTMQFFDSYKSTIALTLHPTQEMHSPSVQGSEQLQNLHPTIQQFLLDHSGCDAFVCHSESTWRGFGKLPTLEQLKLLAKELVNIEKSGKLTTHDLSATHPYIAPLLPGFAGAAAVWKSDDSEIKTFCLWLRVPASQTIVWGSRELNRPDPETGALKSFGSWVETLGHQGLPWSRRAMTLFDSYFLHVQREHIT